MLADAAGGRRVLVVAPAPATVRDVLDALGPACPAWSVASATRPVPCARFVNLYVDEEDVRHGEGLATAVRPGSELHVLPSVAGG